jgi:two-component system invasion response regulator UvrY
MLRVLLADDHQIVRDGLKKLITDNLGKVVFGDAADGVAALVAFDKERWDLVLLDLTLPKRNGLQVLGEMKARKPEVPVLIVSALAEEEVGLRVLKAGAAGFVPKESDPGEIVRAIRKAITGSRYISPAMAEIMAMNLSGNEPEKPHQKLSDREYTVMKMIGSGSSPAEIAKALCISVKTVTTYRAHILQKMNLRGNAELIRYALQNGIVE